jgi:hypothetical protein
MDVVVIFPDAILADSGFSAHSKDCIRKAKILDYEVAAGSCDSTVAPNLRVKGLLFDPSLLTETHFASRRTEWGGLTSAIFRDALDSDNSEYESREIIRLCLGIAENDFRRDPEDDYNFELAWNIRRLCGLKLERQAHLDIGAHRAFTRVGFYDERRPSMDLEDNERRPF